MSSSADRDSSQSFQMPDFGGIDLSKFSVAAPNEEDIDFIPYNKKGRDFSGKLFFNVGTCWLSSMVIGGIYGSVVGISSGTSNSLKLRMNAILNGVSKYGTKASSTCGMIGLIYTSVSHVLDEYLDLDSIAGTPIVTPTLSGALTACIYFFPRTIRGGVVATLGGSILGFAFWQGKNFVANRGRRY